MSEKDKEILNEPQELHEWDDTGERCLKCGDKDWLAGPVCTGKPPQTQAVHQLRSKLGGGWDDVSEDEYNCAHESYERRTLYTHPPQYQGVPEGWKLVPLEPTQAMLDSGYYPCAQGRGSKSVWAAMLDSTPEPPTTQQPSKAQGVPEGFYCNAAICNGCGHVYMERPSSCDCGNDERINGFEPAAVFTAADLSTPAAPQADEWVKCSERLPTEADADPWGCAALLIPEYEHFCESTPPLRVDVSRIPEIFERYPSALWTSTGLTRPQPPEQGDGV